MEAAELEDGKMAATGLVSEISVVIESPKTTAAGCWFSCSSSFPQDCIALVDQQLLYTCCPFLCEWSLDSTFPQLCAWGRAEPQCSK